MQKHVLLQVAEAWEVQRRAKDQLAKALQRSERLSGEADSLRAEIASLTSQLQRSTRDCASAAASAARLQAERDDLMIRLATTSGRLEAATQQVAKLMGGSGYSARPQRRRPWQEAITAFGMRAVPSGGQVLPFGAERIGKTVRFVF